MSEYFVCNECGQVFESKFFHTGVCNCGGKLEKLNVVASWGLCNTASLNVFKIENGINDKMLVAINDHKPEWCVIDSYFDPDIEEGEDSFHLGIKYNDSIYFLDECEII